MSKQTGRATAIVLAAGAILLGALASAPQAGAATLYACVKKNGTAHIYAKKPKCRKHETKLSWSTEGPAGKNGLNGLNGLNGSNGKEGPQGKEGSPGTARGYAVVSDGTTPEFEGAHPGFSEVFNNGEGEYCLVPAPGSGLDQSGSTFEHPGSAAAVSVDWGWSGGNDGKLVMMRQRPYGNCPKADFEVYTFELLSGEFKFSNSVGFHILVP